MRSLIIIFLMTFASPASAQVEAPESLLEQLDRLTKPLVPMLRDLGERIEKLPNYHPPEVLPNGDIIIRRKPDLEEETSPKPEPLQIEPLDL
jgi:hypothetical protein